MDENSDFDFVPGINVRQEILPYQHEPKPDVISGQDSEFESDSDDIEPGDECAKSLRVVLDTRTGEISFAMINFI